MNGRRTGGFSLRKALEDQGVTTEDEMRGRLQAVYNLMQIRKDVDVTRYRKE